MIARRKFIFLIAAATVMPLACCADSEAQKVQAFADFLQTRILDRPGVHIPILTDEERKSIGHFEADFLILKGFNDDLSASVHEYGKAMHPFPTSISPTDLPKYRPDLVTAREMFSHAGDGLGGALARAKSELANSKQPEIVKLKFDAAFDQVVIRPEKALREIIPLAIEALDTEIAIADFLAAHKADVTSVGNQLRASKPNVRIQLESLFTTYSAITTKVNEARRNLDLIVEGH